MRDVAVVGIGMVDFGELWEKSLRTIWAEAAVAALADAGWQVRLLHIQGAVIVGSRREEGKGSAGRCDRRVWRKRASFRRRACRRVKRTRRRA